MEDDRGDTPLIVKVDDGKCSIGTFAAAIQVIYKEIASKAILKAETAMKNAGIDLEVDPSTNTIDFAWGQYSNALGNYFNITDFKSLPPGSRYEKLEEVFNEGGCGILMDETHMVLQLSMKTVYLHIMIQLQDNMIQDMPENSKN